MTNTNEKLLQLFSSEEFKAEAANIQTAEELRTLFETHGVNLSIEEVLELCEAIAKQMESNELSSEGEISEDGLENVAGGFVVSALAITTGAVCIGVCVAKIRKIL